MQRTTKPNLRNRYLRYKTSLVSGSTPGNPDLILSSKSPDFIPRKNPINAKGIAKMV
jgi:hypothetical protein